MNRKQPCLQYTGLELAEVVTADIFRFSISNKILLKVSSNEKSTETVHKL